MRAREHALTRRVVAHLDAAVTAGHAKQGVFYPGEGWFLRFDSSGYRYELVER